MSAPFFWPDITSGGSPGKIYFSPGGPPWAHMTPPICVNPEKNAYFEIRGFSEENVERQGKVYQNVWDEPTYTLIFFFGP